MHTGAFAALPDSAWATPDGIGFRDLAGKTEQLLCQISGNALTNPTAIMELALKVSRLTAVLRDLAASELAVGAILEAGRACERTVYPGRHRRLHVV